MIFTFYSYKGGVGRSMALVNIAEYFAQEGKNVLMIDWDLEAPGLERFYFEDAENIQIALSHRGIIDLLVDYKLTVSQKIELNSEGELPLEKVDDRLLIDLTDNLAIKKSGSRLRLLTAGKRSSGQLASYAQRVVTFDWIDFYKNWEGEFYFEWLRKQLNDLADIVLIDSRTGVTEMGGVCTYHLADSVVMFCGASAQNIDGTERMGRNFRSDTVRSARDLRPLNIIVVPARVEFSGNESDLNYFNAEVERFHKWLPKSVQTYFPNLWDFFGIEYVPVYAFKETVPMRKGPEDAYAKKVKPAYTNLAKAMAIASQSESLRHIFPELRDQQEAEIAQSISHLEMLVSNEQLVDAEGLLSDVQYRYPENELVKSMQRQVDGLRHKLSELERVKGYEQYVNEGVKANLTDLRRFVAEIDSVRTKYQDYRDDLLPIQSKIQARANFIEGKQAFDEERYEQARDLLEGARDLLEGVENDTAKDLLKLLDEAREKEGELDRIIRQVRELRESRKDTQWARAYDLLSSWKNMPLVPHLQDRVRRELEDLAQEWQSEVIERLGRLPRETSPEKTTIDGYLDILKKIGSARLNEWERKALGPYYAKIARERQRNGVYEGEGGCLIAWEQAIRVDPDNEIYRNEQYKAEKEFAEIRIIANPKDYGLMVQLYGELIKKNRQDAANYINLADAYLRQKEFDQAENAWLGAEAILQSNADVPGHVLVSLQAVKERGSREKEIALRQNLLRDKLQPDRKGYKYREAGNEFQKLLAEYPNEYSNLKLWWEETIDTLARQLEDKTNEARQKETALWLAAEPLLKLLLLQPEHAEMRRLLNEVYDDLIMLIQAIEQVVADERKKGDYLGEKGFGEVSQLQEKAQGYMALLWPYADKLQLPEWQTQLRTLEAQEARLTSLRQQLQEIITLIAQGNQAIELGKLAGEWGKAEQIARQLQQSDVRETAPVVKFVGQLEQAKADHALLLARLKMFELAVQKNSFFEAYRLGEQIGQYYDDNKNVNPDTREYQTKLHPLPVRFSQLHLLLQNYAHEAEAYYEWLRPVLLIAPWRCPNIVVPLPRQNNLEALNDLIKEWLATTAANETTGGGNQIFHLVQQMVKKGSFTEALALCADVIGAGQEQMERQSFAGRYTLEFLRRRLSDQPRREEWLVQELPINEAVRLGEVCLGQINLWIQEAYGEQQRISDLHKEFEQIRGEVIKRLRLFEQDIRFRRRRKNVGDTQKLCDQLSKISPENKEVERFRSILRIF